MSTPLQRRSFSSLPPYLQTNRNNLELAVTDDVLYEPEQAAFISGYIGNTSGLTAQQLTRTPLLIEASAQAQKYQFTVGIAQQDPVTQNFISGAFYDDLINHLTVNGAIVTDPNLLFESNFYAWAPPIDDDKIVNFARYFWTGSGTASANGEYITKEAAGTVTTLYQFDGTDLNPFRATIVNGLPGSGSANEVVEDVSTPNRYLYQWTGSTWGRITFSVAPNPTILPTYSDGEWVYITMTGPMYNRPVLWCYRPYVGRWVSLQVVVNSQQPSNPCVGMLWEDTTAIPARIIRIYDGSQWQLLQAGGTDVFDGSTINYTAAAGPSGTPTEVTYLYDTRSVSAVDSWSAQNWWRSIEDITAADQANATQGARPIIELWGNIETAAGNTRTARDQFPLFNVYMVAPTSFDILPVTPGNFSGLNTTALTTAGRYVGGTAVSTLFQYVVPNTGVTDIVLGFRIEYASDGTPSYSLDLEAMPITYTNGNIVLGYRFFRDTATGYVHSVWEKATAQLEQTVDGNGLYSVPETLTANADHFLTTQVSRSTFIDHFTSIIESQDDFSGTPFGSNSWRFSPKQLTLGAQMIDPEESLFRTMAVLQTGVLDIPDAIRSMSNEYNKVMTRFVNQLNILWNNGTLSTYMDTLSVTYQQGVDIILTILFTGRNEEFPFFYSVMGTFMETRLVGGVPFVFNSTPQPIYIPDSPALIGAAPAYQPAIFTDEDGISKIRGHDGSLIPAFGDDRDQVILNLENRFFNSISSYLTTESPSFSSRYNSSRFCLSNYYGNFIPNLTAGTVVNVVADYTTIVSPVVGDRIYSINQQLYVTWSGSVWLSQQAQAGDVFLNDNNHEYYIFNGFFTEAIPTSNHNFAFDYSMQQYREVIEREFERYVITRDLDYITTNQYEPTDPFTFNYSSAGVEGNYQGIYLRVYNTVRPHSHPWEIMGYSIQPSWFLTQYPPTSTASDGTPRYAKTHHMWTDFQNGVINPITAATNAAVALVAPIPVDNAGNLVDPITSGLINPSALTPSSLGDDWQYGDGSPIEQQWISSYFYSYAVALAGYLMKTGQFVDRTWSLFYRTIGDLGSNLLYNGPAIVYNTTLTRPEASLVPSQLSLDVNGNPVQNPGFNAWIAEYSVLIGKSANVDFNNAILNSQAALGWKCAGFVNAARTSFELLNGDEIPAEDFSVVLHQGPSTDVYFQSGVVIVRDTDGYRVYGTDMLDPWFTVDVGNISSTAGQIQLLQQFTYDGNNRTFTVTEFTVPPATNDTAIFAVLVNGFALQSKFVQRLSGTQFAIDPTIKLTAGDAIVASVVIVSSTPAQQLGSFTVNNVTITYAQVGTGTLVNYPYGTLFETLNDVANMFVGYGRFLSSQGWVFERNTNGTIRDWLAAAQAFAIWATDLGQSTNGSPLLQKGKIFEYSVMGRQTQFDAGFGMILGVEDIRNGSYGVVDVNSQPIEPANLDIVSTGGAITVSSGTTDIFGLRLYVSVVQHVIFFPNVTTFGDIIYQPALGLAQQALFVDTYRTTAWTGRLEAPGFLVSGGQLGPIPTNPSGQIATPTGALFPDWEKQVSDITRYYDRFNPPDDPVLAAMARDLYGYSPKTYLSELQTDDRQQFNFFRGMLKAKGTTQPYFAYARGTTIPSGDFTVAEDWAWKFARYGDERIVTVLFNVTPDDFVDTYQVISFDTNSFSINFTGDEHTTCFNLEEQFQPDDLVVLNNGILQVIGVDYSITETLTGYEVCFMLPPLRGNVINMSLNDNLAQLDQEVFYQNSVTHSINTGLNGVTGDDVLLAFDGFLQPNTLYSVSDGVIDYSDLSGAEPTFVMVFGNSARSVFEQTSYESSGFVSPYSTQVPGQTINTCIVTVNQVWQTPGIDYTTTISGGLLQINFGTPPPLTDHIVIFETNAPHNIRSAHFGTTGDGSTRQFNVPGITIPGYKQVMVAVNGLVQTGPIPGTSNGNTYVVANGGILFNTAPTSGAKIAIFAVLGVVGSVIQEVVDNRIIQIPEFNPPNADTRWIIPPPENRYKDAPYHFPIKNDQADLKKFKYDSVLVDKSGHSPATTMFHWDPGEGLHEPLAESLITYQTPYDPARYNNGPNAGTQDNLIWSDFQVGQIWWNTSAAVYSDYKAFLPDVMQVSREWGNLLYYYANITRTNQTVTVQTLNSMTRQVASNNLQTGDYVTISGADQPTYNGIFQITVISSSEFTFTVTFAADSPGTGDIIVSVGQINVYEWVASPVPPSAWHAFVQSQQGFNLYSGTVLNTSNPNYSTQEVWDVNGNATTTYYFWVQGNTRIGVNPVSTSDIAGRLQSPAQYEIPYFGIMDPMNMFVFIGADTVSDNYAIEITYKWQEMPRHVEWLLIGEGSDFQLVPSLVTDKLIDSILETDGFGNPVPNVTLAPISQFGTLNFPAQTVFRNASDALSIFVEATNDILVNIDLGTLPTIFADLPTDQEFPTHTNGYWSETIFWDSSVTNPIIYDVVENTTELLFRASQQLYAPGDIVNVLSSDQNDLWTGHSVASYYQFGPDSFQGSITGTTLTVTSITSNFLQVGQLITDNTGTVNPNTIITDFGTGTGGVGTYIVSGNQTVASENLFVFTLVGIDGHTASINTNIVNTAATFRDFFNDLITALPILTANGLIFDLLREMVRQSSLCDWFFKTSYIDLHVTEPLPVTAFVEPDMAALIYQAVLDLKPYRTKIRDQVTSYNAEDDLPVDIGEQEVTKDTLVFDRLACDLNDENAWDTIMWDATATYPVDDNFNVTFVGNSFQTCFILPVAPTEDDLVVFLNNVLTVAGVDYNFDEVNNELCFTTPPPTGEIISVFIDSTFEYVNRYTYTFTGDGSIDSAVLPSGVASAVVDDVFSVWDGVHQVPGTDYTVQITSQSEVVYSSAPNAGVVVEGFVLGGIIDSIFNAITFTGDGSTVSFATGLTGATGADVIVSTDGVLQTLGHDFTLDNTTPSDVKVVFTTAPASGVKILIYAVVVPDDVVSSFYTFTADGTTSFFAISNPEIALSTVIVNLQGVQQLDSVDYALITAGTTGVQFPEAPDAGLIINIYVFTTAVGHRLSPVSYPATIQWDWAFWNYADLGRQEYDLAGVAIGDGTTESFTLPIPQTSTNLYNTSLQVYLNGVLTSLTALGLTVQTIQTPTAVTLVFSSALPVNSYAALYLARGFYEGLEPTFGYQDPSGIVFTPTPSSYQHYFARLISPTFNPSNVMQGCPTPDERMQAEADDMFTIAVTTVLEEFQAPPLFHIFGVQATSGIGHFSISDSSSVSLHGLAATSAIGTVHVHVTSSYPLVGLAAVAAVGTLAVGYELIGEDAISQHGSFVVERDPIVDLHGLFVTSHVGGIHYFRGVAGTSEVGSFSVLIDKLGHAGQAATSGHGHFVPMVTIHPQGQQAVSVLGAKPFSPGQQAVSAVGHFVPLLDKLGHAGQQVTSETGQLFVTPRQVALTGQHATASVGTMSVETGI
jgi:hypothetical protein